jgi:hypothetical protein
LADDGSETDLDLGSYERIIGCEVGKENIITNGTLLKELMEELSSIKTAQRTNSIKSVLAEKKLNPKIANFIPADLDSSPEAIDNWIAENAEVFGLQVQKQEVNPDIATLRQIDAVAASANVPIGGDDLLLRLDQATSAAEIEQMIFGSQS